MFASILQVVGATVIVVGLLVAFGVGGACVAFGASVLLAGLAIEGR